MEMVIRISVMTLIFLVMQYIGYKRGQSSIMKKLSDESVGTLFIDYNDGEPDIYINLYEHPDEFTDNEIVRIRIRKRENMPDSHE